MKKRQRRIKLFAIIVVVIFTAFMIVGLLPTDAKSEMYIRFANVIDLEYLDDVVTADDGCGNLWEFYGVDYFEYDDLIVMLMDDNDTPDWIYDDIVVSVSDANIWMTIDEYTKGAQMRTFIHCNGCADSVLVE